MDHLLFDYEIAGQMRWFLAGVKLTFFTVAAVGLCFEFMLSRVDNTEMFFLLLSQAYTEPRPLRLFILLRWHEIWVCLGGWEETQPG